MKKLLSLAVALGFVFILNACNTTDTPAQDPQAPHNDAVAREQEAFVALVDPFVRVDSGRRFVLDARASSSLSTENLARAGEYLKAANQEIAAGTLVANDDNSLRPSGTDLMTQANQNGVKWYWWGVRIALDHFRTVRVISTLAGGGALGGLIPGVGRYIGAVAGVGTAGLAACDARARGVYVYTTWAGFPWCRPQPA